MSSMRRARHQIARGGLVGNAAHRLRRGFRKGFKNCAHARCLAGFGGIQKAGAAGKANRAGRVAVRWTASISSPIVKAMRHEDIWDVEAADRYDTPGTGMFAPDVLGPAVDRLAELAEGGRALEFAIGTGRVAIPLSERGVPVTGIELSPPMVAQLRTKVDEATIPVIVGDMATAVAPGSYTLVYLVFNGISNVLTQAEQVACFRNAARHLSPGGRFVIELWVPELRKMPPGQQAVAV